MIQKQFECMLWYTIKLTVVFLLLHRTFLHLVYKMDGSHLANSYLICCSFFIINWIALGLRYHILFKCCSDDKAINFLMWLSIPLIIRTSTRISIKLSCSCILILKASSGWHPVTRNTWMKLRVCWFGVFLLKKKKRKMLALAALLASHRSCPGKLVLSWLLPQLTVRQFLLSL